MTLLYLLLFPKRKTLWTQLTQDVCTSTTSSTQTTSECCDEQSKAIANTSESPPILNYTAPQLPTGIKPNRQSSKNRRAYSNRNRVNTATLELYKTSESHKEKTLSDNVSEPVIESINDKIITSKWRVRFTIVLSEYSLTSIVMSILANDGSMLYKAFESERVSISSVHESFVNCIVVTKKRYKIIK